MQIIWHGQSCFFIKSKSQDKEINILVNPCDSKKLAKANIVLLNNEILDRKKLKKIKAFIIDSAGEFEIKNNFVQGISDNKNIVFVLEVEGIHLVDLGEVKHLENGLLSKLQNVDILILPINKEKFLNIDEATEIINQLEPRIIIASNYQESKEIKKFAEKVGANLKEAVDKFKIMKKNLPQDGREIIILNKKS
ncbi:MAG: hypothetical protein GWO87_02185 [Xanthomonadaceae bacterium]|nr:hypothetical protein [Rhodospirillaceae bacterium]NIA17977.1 hypothetical protein [Xanthomonadaceae bacterium]